METTAESLTFIAFIMMAISSLIASYAINKGRALLSMVSSGSWLLLGVYSYTKSSEVWDILFCAFWFSMFMAVICVYMGIIMREKQEFEPMFDDDAGDVRDEVDPDIEDPWQRNSWSKTTSKAQIRRGKTNKYGDTGVV